MATAIMRWTVLAVLLCGSTAWAGVTLGLGFGNQTVARWIDIVQSLSWSTNTYEFGSQDVDTTSTTTLTITNSGNDTAEDVTTTVTGAGFRLYSSVTFGNISAGKNRVAKVAFTPAGAGAFSGFANYSAPNIGRTSVALSGTGVGSTVDASVQFFWDAENSLVADKGEITGTNNGAIFSNTAKTGNYSFARDSNLDNVTFPISTTHFGKAGGQFGMWIQTANGFQSGSNNNVFRIDASAQNYIRLFVHSSGGLQLDWRGGNTLVAATYSTSALATNTWYYIVGRWNPGNAGNDLVLSIYNTSGEIVGTSSVANIPAMTEDPSLLTLGNAAADAARPLIDHFVLSDDITKDMWGVQNVTAF